MPTSPGLFLSLFLPRSFSISLFRLRLSGSGLPQWAQLILTEIHLFELQAKTLSFLGPMAHIFKFLNCLSTPPQQNGKNNYTISLLHCLDFIRIEAKIQVRQGQ